MKMNDVNVNSQNKSAFNLFTTSYHHQQPLSKSALNLDQIPRERNKSLHSFETQSSFEKDKIFKQPSTQRRDDSNNVESIELDGTKMNDPKVIKKSFNPSASTSRIHLSRKEKEKIAHDGDNNDADDDNINDDDTHNDNNDEPEVDYLKMLKSLDRIIPGKKITVQQNQQYIPSSFEESDPTRTSSSLLHGKVSRGGSSRYSFWCLFN